jgi:hypothetical protein
MDMLSRHVVRNNVLEQWLQDQYCHCRNYKPKWWKDTASQWGKQAGDAVSSEWLYSQIFVEGGLT